jgi:hypothetical protein
LTEFTEDTPIYESFAGQMGTFAREQAMAGHISEPLAVIYEKMIPAALVDDKLAAAMSRVFHCIQITSGSGSWDQVILSYEETEKEEMAILRDGHAIVSMYSQRCRVLFQDKYGNRYAGGVYSSRKMMDAPELEQRCCQVNGQEPYLLMLRCEKALGEGRLDQEALDLYEQVLGLPGLRDCFRRTLISRIVSGSTINAAREDQMGALSPGERLMRLDDRYASREDILRIMEVLIEEDFHDRAFHLMEKYGWEEIKPAALLKLCSRTCVSRLFSQDAVLLKACYDCMEKNRCDDVILEYLCRYFNGTSEQMLKVLLQGIQYHVPLGDLPERLLGQMLFTGSREGMDEVFRAYQNAGPMDETLFHAYLVQKCYDFLNADVAADETVFACVETEGDKLPLLCRIALCRYVSLMPERTEEQMARCMDTIRYCCDHNMVFDFFTAFAGEKGYPQSLRGRTVISYRAKPEEHLRIRYRIRPDQTEFRYEVLPHMYQGYFSKELTVFYGDTVEYEIYRDAKEGAKLLVKDETTAKTSDESTGRMGKLNQMLKDMETMDETMVRREMRDYSMTEVLVEHYFDKM